MAWRSVHLWEVFYGRALTGKILVFWIGGRLWKVLTYERWLYIEVLRVIEAANVVVVAVILVNFYSKLYFAGHYLCLKCSNNKLK